MATPASSMMMRNKIRMLGTLAFLLVITVAYFSIGRSTTTTTLQHTMFRGPSKYAVPALTAREDWLEMEDGQRMEVITGGSNEGSKPTIILLHGASKSSQNAAFWKIHYDFLASVSKFYAVSLFGHGSSTPETSQTQNVIAINKLITEHGISENLIFIARSAGGGLLMNLLRDADISSMVTKLVLIAPAGVTSSVVPASVRQKDVLIFWAGKDPVMNISRLKDVEAGFEKVSTFILPNMATHTPENEAPEEFQHALKSFLSERNETADTAMS